VFKQLPGVLGTEVGYTGGENDQPSYQSVCSGDGHTEALRIRYDPNEVSYEQLLDKFWSLHNPSARYDVQYKSAIWPQNEEQAAIASAAVAAKEEASNLPIFTDLQKPKEFYAAEWYHQNYKFKNKIRLAMLGTYIFLSYMPSGSIPGKTVLEQILAVLIFTSYIPQLLSVFEKFF